MRTSALLALAMAGHLNGITRKPDEPMPVTDLNKVEDRINGHYAHMGWVDELGFPKLTRKQRRINAQHSRRLK